MDITRSIGAEQESLAGTESAPSERELVESARTDRAAFGTLYRLHSRAIYRFVRSRVGDPVASEDIVAETFLEALKSLWRFRFRGVPFRHWLLVIASRCVARWIRQSRRRTTAPLESEPVAPASEAPDPDELEALRGALLRLPVPQQTVLTLFYLEGLRVSEIARAMRSRSGTVKSRLARGRAALHGELRAWREVE
ncbi:MAG: RNA polymerase sigma factor [Planctomycetota bacterium]